MEAIPQELKDEIHETVERFGKALLDVFRQALLDDELGGDVDEGRS